MYTSVFSYGSKMLLGNNISHFSKNVNNIYFL